MMPARFALRLCTMGAALSLIAGSAIAQPEQKMPRAKGSEAATPRYPAAAPNARMAALVRAGGTLIREFNVGAISRPRTGVYCITPSAASGINPLNAIVIVSTEFFYSELNEVKVQWASRGSPCRTADQIAVYTLADLNADGIYSFSNDVGFSIYVP